VNHVTELLARWSGGDREALVELMPLVYGELRDLAEHYMGREQPDHTLQPTALVHEAYLRLAGTNAGQFNNRVHFYGAAAQAMRRVLVDAARKRQARKRGRSPVLVDLDSVSVGVDLREDLVALDDALERLAAVAPLPARVVELRYFGGLSVADIAASLDVSPATVGRYWTFARAWLYRSLKPHER
jgi:RNA polymerase sigma factor (TIGR02999 family)